MQQISINKSRKKQGKCHNPRPSSSDQSDSLVDQSFDDAFSQMQMKQQMKQHSAAYFLMAVCKEKYPQIILLDEFANENGFYYEFGVNSPLSDEEIVDLEIQIQSLLKAVQKQQVNLDQYHIRQEEAFLIFRNDPYKIHQLMELNHPSPNVCQIGNCIDLCDNSIVLSIEDLHHIKLHRSEYRAEKGDKNRNHASFRQRIFGVAI